ncbi:trypsin-like serine peptidase [Streptomyces sp. NPDC008313]|uniref:trypsin-like serine peptidase n=1 Tax=Streptomyces sp. NPDC008313 TaxID=3364826 RepID=UPI0036E2A9F1
MKRSSRLPGARRRALYGAAVLLAVSWSSWSSSSAAAEDGTGLLGVTTPAAATAASARVGVLYREGGGHFCTASVVHSARHDVIATAAHCLDGDGAALLFAPGYRDGATPYGVWRVGRTYVADAWKQSRDEDSDIAFAVVAEAGGDGGTGGRGVEDAVSGGNALATGRVTGAAEVTLTGYPKSLDTPVTCTNRPTVHSAGQQRVACPDFPGGTSGSPWVNGDGEIVGVIGGHEQGGDTADVSYSVVLGDAVARLYQDAVRAG